VNPRFFVRNPLDEANTTRLVANGTVEIAYFDPSRTFPGVFVFALGLDEEETRALQMQSRMAAGFIERLPIYSLPIL